MHKTYEFLSPLPAHEASERIEKLLSKESVEFTAANLTIASVRTPLVFINADRRLYSNRNWIGLNPFIFVSGVEVRCEQSNNGFTKVTVRINRLRTFLLVAFSVVWSMLLACVMPEPGGVILVVVVACAMWFGTVSFFGGRLVKKEISDCLKNS
jgi:hypothetical protein